MVIVKIELWPHGDESRATPLGTIKITNDGTGNEAFGNYDVSLSHSGRYVTRPGTWKRGKVLRHFRGLSPYHLVVKALNACGIGEWWNGANK